MKQGSTTETFVALKLLINSWRWSGVPVFIRAGKCLPMKATEVVIRMKKLKPIYINGRLRESHWYDDYILRLGGDAGISLSVRVKSPGEDNVEPVKSSVDFSKALGDVPEPYELLLTSAMHGDRGFFPYVSERSRRPGVLSSQSCTVWTPHRRSTSREVGDPRPPLI